MGRGGGLWENSLPRFFLKFYKNIKNEILVIYKFVLCIYLYLCESHSQ